MPGLVPGVAVPGVALGGAVGLCQAGAGCWDESVLRENPAEELRHQIMTEQATMSRETIRETTKPVPCFTGAVVNVSGGHGQR